MKHFLYDYETLSQNPHGCAVAACAYILVDSDRFVGETPYTFKELTEAMQFDKLSVIQQKEAGYRIDRDVVDWWKKQSDEVKKQVVPSPADISRAKHIQNIETYLSNKWVDRWWSRGNTFDPIILKEMSDEVNSTLFDKKLRFWNVRDLRTYMDTKFDFTSRTDFCPFNDTKKWDAIFKKHDCIHDVAADVMRMQVIARVEKDLPFVEE